MNDLENKVAIITGAASGIGKAAAISLANKGMKVALVDLNADDLEEVKATINKKGQEAISLEANVAEPPSIQQAIEETVKKWNRIDTVFINAGINGAVSSIEDLTPSEWDTTIETNLKSTFLTVKYSIPHMKTHGGSIIITSSINGNRIFKNFGMSAYSTSKAGQVAFGKMAALELAQYKIRVNMICPGAIDTNIEKNTFKDEEHLKEITIPVEYPDGNQPLAQQSGSAQQVADLVYFLSSDLSNHITGTEVYIDGAESLL
ncbi:MULTISPECIES: SDR family oxidoreductase [Niallia]|uniref:3-oxoacyl-[acyl-carrier-protein] reductase n=1 Tax=Niallia circulans TaxID=1397 RepID=A0A268FBY4_NIACI|nr:SDR family NAD(P)-dependent oxidoreductase [Niallia circulans]AYV67569.1 SDR family NAD(P)-dependent oxidoreductase [Niallia circulans]AYV74074.1 SDR family NAD(P)-dependent oxidoreductase [Niallia circulans]NRG29647.1 SDR family oxidoreductase [Niallia circulans]PAD82864.1 3-oxoacyl-[acyl-carrier-protein] reductase [Niallia circulans]